jgi:hypothetical protein
MGANECNDDCDTEAKAKAKSFSKDEEDKGTTKVASMKPMDEPRVLWIGDEKKYNQVLAMMYVQPHP